MRGLDVVCSGLTTIVRGSDFVCSGHTIIVRGLDAVSSGHSTSLPACKHATRCTAALQSANGISSSAACAVSSPPPPADLQLPPMPRSLPEAAAVRCKARTWASIPGCVVNTEEQTTHSKASMRRPNFMFKSPLAVRVVMGIKQSSVCVSVVTIWAASVIDAASHIFTLVGDVIDA